MEHHPKFGLDVKIDGHTHTHTHTHTPQEAMKIFTAVFPSWSKNSFREQGMETDLASCYVQDEGCQ